MWPIRRGLKAVVPTERRIRVPPMYRAHPYRASLYKACVLNLQTQPLMSYLAISSYFSAFVVFAPSCIVF